MWEEVEKNTCSQGQKDFHLLKYVAFVDGSSASTTRFFKERRLVHMNVDKSLDEGFLKMFYVPHLQLQNKKSTRHPLHFTSKSWFPTEKRVCDVTFIVLDVQIDFTLRFKS